MAKITDLPSAASLTGTEAVPIVQDGAMKKTTLEQLVDAAVQPAIDQAEMWAEGTQPGGPGTKSAKEHAQDAQASSGSIMLRHGATATGTANAIAVATTTANWTNIVGGRVTFVPTVANTGAVTLAVDGQTARAVQSASGLALGAGALQPGVRYDAVYAAGDVFRILSPALGSAVVDSDALASVAAYRENNGRVTEVDYGDGRKLIPLLDTTSHKSVRSTVGEQTVTKQMFRDFGGALVSSVEVFDTDVAAIARVDSTGRAMEMWTPQGGLRIHQPWIIAAARSRRAGSGNWVVFSRRRSASSLHFDLYSLDLTTGVTRRLTSDTTDTFDFHDPAVAGTHCWFTRSSGTNCTELAVPLAATATNQFVQTLPENEILFGGDSFGGAPTGQFLVDHLNADPATIAAGRTFRLAVSPGSAIFANGGRSLTGTYYALAGGTTGPTDSPANFTYTGTQWGRGGIFVFTDDRNLNGGEATITAWMDRLEQLMALQSSAQKRWLIMEPGLPLGGVSGTANRTAWEANEAAIKTRFPNNYSPCLEYIQTNGNDGSVKDIEYVAAGLWPASCYINPGASPATVVDGHPSNPKGRQLYGQSAAISIIAKGWNK